MCFICLLRGLIEKGEDGKIGLVISCGCKYAKLSYSWKNQLPFLGKPLTLSLWHDVFGAQDR